MGFDFNVDVPQTEADTICFPRGLGCPESLFDETVVRVDVRGPPDPCAADGIVVDEIWVLDEWGGEGLVGSLRGSNGHGL